MQFGLEAADSARPLGKICVISRLLGAQDIETIFIGEREGEFSMVELVRCMDDTCQN